MGRSRCGKHLADASQSITKMAEEQIIGFLESSVHIGVIASLDLDVMPAAILVGFEVEVGGTTSEAEALIAGLFEMLHGDFHAKSSMVLG